MTSSEQQPRAPEADGDRPQDAKQHPPTNSTEALEAMEKLFREAMRIGVDSSELVWREQQETREREARRLAQAAEALASTYREENERLREVLGEIRKKASDGRRTASLPAIARLVDQALTTPRTETGQ